MTPETQKYKDEFLTILEIYIREVFKYLVTASQLDGVIEDIKNLNDSVVDKIKSEQAQNMKDLMELIRDYERRSETTIDIIIWRSGIRVLRPGRTPDKEFRTMNDLIKYLEEE